MSKACVTIGLTLKVVRYNSIIIAENNVKKELFYEWYIPQAQTEITDNILRKSEHYGE